MDCTIRINVQANSCNTDGWHTLAEDYRRQVALSMWIELELETEIGTLPNVGSLVALPERHSPVCQSYCEEPGNRKAMGSGRVREVEIGAWANSTAVITLEKEWVSDGAQLCSVVLDYVRCYGFSLCIGSQAGLSGEEL
ncbi:MAG: hypothetical protein JSS66_08140 [Armatimonadetes bacterium]|nr:hypothetical protein [Armatimonadota bacterium]